MQLLRIRVPDRTCTRRTGQGTGQGLGTVTVSVRALNRMHAI